MTGHSHFIFLSPGKAQTLHQNSASSNKTIKKYKYQNEKYGKQFWISICNRGYGTDCKIMASVFLLIKFTKYYFISGTNPEYVSLLLLITWLPKRPWYGVFYIIRHKIGHVQISFRNSKPSCIWHSQITIFPSYSALTYFVSSLRIEYWQKKTCAMNL